MEEQIEFLKEITEQHLKIGASHFVYEEWSDWMDSYGKELTLQEWKQVAGEIGRTLKTYYNPATQKLGRELITDGDQYTVVYQVGNYFVKSSFFRIAEIFLRKALEMEPGSNAVIQELAACFEKQGRFDLAEKELQQFISEGYPIRALTYYLVAFYRIVNLDLEGAQAYMEQISSASGENRDYFLRSLKLALLRAELSTNFSPQQRWYFILTESFVLQESPLALAHDHIMTYALVGKLLPEMKAAFQVLGVVPEQVLHNRKEKALPIAIGELFGVKIKELNSQKDASGLLVVPDLEGIKSLSFRPQNVPGFSIFSLGVKLNKEYPTAGDILGGFMGQKARPQWQMHFLPETKTRVPKDPRPDEEIAKDILDHVAKQPDPEWWAATEPKLQIIRRYREERDPSLRRATAFYVSQDRWGNPS